MLISPRFMFSRLRNLACFLGALSLLALLGASVGYAQTITHVQSNFADPQTAQITVAVPYAAAQTAGNLNVVVVGWNDSTALVQSVADSSLNVYVLAVGPTVQAGTATQAIYYAKNISAAAANANSVTVTFNVAAQFPDIRIAEYSGLDLVNPLDVVAAAVGSSATSSSGAVTTTNANDLLVAANVVQTRTTGPGTGFTQRLISDPDLDILEDRVVTTAASYNATAPVSPSGAWIMQMVSFRAAGSVPVPTPTAPTNLTATAASPVQIDLSWTASTETGGTIGQYLIERCTGASCGNTPSNFAQVATSTTTTFSDTGRLGSTTYNYRVRAKDTANTTGPYSNVAAATTAAPTFTAPSNLTATAAGPVQINLSWTAATETGGAITNYLIERCAGTNCGNTPSNFAQIGTSAAVTFSDSGLLGSTTYNYRVRATDASSNTSPYSNIAAATTAAPTFTAPSNLAAAVAGATQLNLSWTAATETGGTLSLYLIERCAGTNCGNTPSNFAQVGTSATTTFSDTALVTSTSYSYRVRATDAANNLGPYSNIASATPASAPTNLTATAGTPQSATINTVFAAQLQATLKDSANNPVSGVTVTFTAPASGASGAFAGSLTATATTSALGVATAPVFTANGTAGGPYVVTASAPGAAAAANFSLTNLSPAALIARVQHRSLDAGTTTSASLAFNSNNTAGNWIGVVIRAGKSGQVFTVADSRGNTYRKAIQFNETTDTTTLGIFYAENIAAGANTITVSDTISGTLRFAILEYSGVAIANSLDGAAVASQGTSASASVNLTTTTANGDLLLAGISTANAATFTAGNGYLIQETVPAEPNTKLIAEDQFQATAGSASAGASLGASDHWGAAAAAFKAAAGSGGTAPSITSLNPTSGIIGTSVTISGSNFGSTQGTSTVTFNGTIAAPTSWGATSIMVPVPTGASTGNVVVTVASLASNGVNFTLVVPPSITSLTPNSGAIGTSVTIAGANFGATQGSSTVTFNGIATTPTIWTATSIAAPVPNGATTGNVIVTVGGVLSNGVAFTVTNPGPSISTLSLSQGPVGASITIIGLNFGASQGASKVTFNGTAATPTAWSDTSIDAPVPAGATTGNVVVTVSSIPSNGVPFTVTPPPSITSLNPTAGPVGTVVTVNGANFGPTIGTRASFVSFNGTGSRPNTWSDTQILVPVPAGATTGNVVVSLSGVLSNGMNFIVASPPSITNLNPSSGPVGTSVTITGANFGATQVASTVTFNGVTASPTGWNDLSITVPVPSGAATGNVIVTVNGQASPGVNFTVPSSGLPIALVQHTSLNAGTTTSASLIFPATNTAGNWIAVVVRAGNTGQVFTVTDTRGNTYRKASQFNETLDGTTLGVLYAENIAGGANTVTVSDTISGTMRFAILEYSGVALVNSLDAVVTKQGASISPTSGTLVTSVSGALLLAEISTANAATFTPGSGYLAEELIPSAPNTKLFVEDQIQAAAGSVSAGASLGASDNWGAILAAFKSASGAPPPPITVTVVPATASVGTGGGTQLFTAQLVNDVQSKGVTWALSGAGCSGSTCGTLSAATTTTVTYTGPAAIPNPAAVTLTATSVADTTKTGTAAITVVQGSLSVTLSPKRGSITPSQTQQFTATVFNDPSNAGVTWQVDGNTGGNSVTGTISAAGLFTPGSQPGLHTIMATSVTNASANASVSFAVTDLSGVLMHHNDPARTGQNLKEYALTPANVRSATFAQLFSCPVDGYVYAQPLWVPSLTVSAAVHNVLFVATEHDSVYAFDADSPSCTQLWKRSFLGTGVTTMPWQDTSLGTSIPATNDVFPEIGITSTPVIDPATNTIYVVAKTKETVGAGCSSGSPCYISRLHAMDITTGAEKFGGPVAITGSNFVSLRHFNRPALLLLNNTVYIAFGSHGDISNWYGWLFGYDPATLARKFVFSTSDPTSGSNGAAIWNSGAGPAADASGNVYVSTGNGAYDGVKNFSESSLKISPSGSLLDWFTPSNRATLDANDIDLGSAGVIILPDSVGSTAHPHLALSTGKIAVLFLLDQANMGKFNSGGNLDVQEVIPVPPPNTTQLDGGNYGVPAYWNGNIYTTGQNYPLSQFKISNGSMATPQFAVSSNTFPSRGATPGVSASGTTNGIVWVLDLSGWTSGGDAILDAYDASNVSNLLFSSPSSGSGAAGPAVKFTVPTVANGKVYVGGQSTVVVFGLLSN